MHITLCLSRHAADPWLRGLRSAFPDATVSEWQPGAAPADYAVVWSPPQAFFDEQPGLKAVFNAGAGVDALLALRIPPGTRIVRIDDGGMAVQMAEFACQAVIRHFRELDAYAGDLREGRWSYREPRARQDFPVGVMGLGVLGERVARALTVFDFPVHGWSRTPKRIEGVHCHAGEAGFDGFLASCRVLINLLPLTPQTENILNRRTLGRLQPGGYLINLARGAHLVDQDLLDLIDSGQLAGAALDVFRTEPLPADHGFWKRPTISITPHTSARTLRAESIEQIARKIAALGRGEAVAGEVDRQRGY